MAKRFSKYSGKKKEIYLLRAGPDGKRRGQAQSTWKEGVQDTSRVIQMLNRRQEHLQVCDRW